MVKIINKEMPKKQYPIKCPHEMKPTRIVIHNTANDASAQNEVAHMQRNGNKVSFHYAVDDKEIVQGIPLTRNSWNAGDGGNGKGNREGISIEICYSKSGGSRFEKAQENAAELTAYLLKKYGWGLEKVTKHQDYNGKHCPHRTLDQYGWDYFIKLVKKYKDAAEKPKTTTTKKTYKKGDKITLSSCPLYASATDKNYRNKKTGTYYIYDGIETNKRFRITISKALCGKKPTGVFVTGWVNKTDIK